jgi:FkbM family methyltransferase
MLCYRRPLGRMLRWPLKAIPKTLVVPIVSGPNRGMRWIAGAFLHSCWLGFYEKQFAKYVAGLVRPNMIAFDVGANVGYYTLLLARRVGPGGRVIAFEPNPVNIACLKRHLRLNKITNVEIVEAAVSDCSGTSYFSGDWAEGKLAQTGSLVKTVRLDDYPRPDLVKMDIEGGETAALRGAENILDERHAIWFISVHDGPSYTECPALLTSKNYSLDWIGHGEACARAAII